VVNTINKSSLDKQYKQPKIYRYYEHNYLRAIPNETMNSQLTTKFILCTLLRRAWSGYLHSYPKEEALIEVGPLVD